MICAVAVSFFLLGSPASLTKRIQAESPSPTAKAQRTIGRAEVQVLTNQTLAIHYIEGYEVREKPGKPEYDGSVVLEPLDIKAATNPENYVISSPAHSSYVAGQHPEQVGRKMKGRDFVNEAWKKTSFVPEHWIYLQLQSPLMERVEYTLILSKVLSNQADLKFTFNSAGQRSEVVHTNQIG